MHISIFQLLSSFKIIPYPYDLFWLFLPSLLLAPVFLITMICLNFSAPRELQIWSTIGRSFAVIYCAFATLIYFTQITVVLPEFYKGAIDENYILFFKWKTFTYAIDCLGYFFMSLSTLFSAGAFKRDPTKYLYRGLLWNGLMLPVIVAAYFFPPLIYAGALWFITFPWAMISAAAYFKKRN